MAITPMMRHSLAILKMSGDELSDAVKAELLENPLLECSGDWEPAYIQKSSMGFLENICKAREMSLADSLKMQLHMAVRSEGVIRVSEYMIDCLDQNGYLAEKVESIARALRIKRECVLKCMRLIQTFEPYGVCARSLRECLMIQATRLHPENSLVQLLVKNHLTQLGNYDYAGIANATGRTVEEISGAVAIIRTLNPKPGAAIGGGDVKFAIPDVVIAVEDGMISVELANDPPRLAISASYKNYLESGDAGARRYARSQHAKAKNLIRSVEQRASTLLRAARVIALRQKKYFLHGGPVAPLTLAEIADELELNISTVSRALSGKYIQYGVKIIPFQFFLPSRLQSGNSSVEIKSMIEEMIAAEDKSKPLSDSKIMQSIRRRGIEVALRTVTKYRNTMGVPCASARKKRAAI